MVLQNLVIGPLLLILGYIMLRIDLSLIGIFVVFQFYFGFYWA